jgi:hypothetical protein
MKWYSGEINLTTIPYHTYRGRSERIEEVNDAKVRILYFRGNLDQ